MHDDPIGIRLFDLRVSSCRWPLGDRGDQTEYFCGKPAVPGCSWCPAHRKQAFSRSSGVGGHAKTPSAPGGPETSAN
jgi:hypothetical protein